MHIESNNKTFSCTIYIFLYIAYSIISIIYPGTIMSQGILAIFLLISTLYTFVCIKDIHIAPNYIKRLFNLIVLFTIYGALYYISNKTYIITQGMLFAEVSKSLYLKNIFLSILPIFTFYHFGTKGMISETWLRKISIILMILSIFMFTYKHNAFVIGDEYGRTEMTNNYGYYFVSLIPLLCFWRKKPIILLGLCLIILTFILVSMKRGAILTGVVCILYFIASIFRQSKFSGKIALIITLAATFYFTMPIISRFISNSEYFQSRIEDTAEGNSSNRDILYSKAADHIFNEAPLHQFLFGSGADSSIAVLSNYAHNDWLEIGINQGILGIILYLLYFMSFYKLWHTDLEKGPLRESLGLCLIVCFMTTLFSMSYNSMFISICVCIGYAAANKRTNTYKSTCLH